jgi:hypothetical protein
MSILALDEGFQGSGFSGITGAQFNNRLAFEYRRICDSGCM